MLRLIFLRKIIAGNRRTVFIRDVGSKLRKNMNRLINIFFLFSSLINYSQTDKQILEFENYVIHNLNETIKEDFNGDGLIDKAVFIQEQNKSGIKITDGKTGETKKIGLGEEFEEMGDDFSWVDYWGVIKDQRTFEIIIIDGEILGEETVILENTSIFIRKEDLGGGIITFRNGKYEWIHQSD